MGFARDELFEEQEGSSHGDWRPMHVWAHVQGRRWSFDTVEETYEILDLIDSDGQSTQSPL